MIYIIYKSNIYIIFIFILNRDIFGDGLSYEWILFKIHNVALPV